MEKEPPPSKVPRLSLYHDSVSSAVTMAAPSPLVLGLGLGVGGGSETCGRSAFTFLQLQELEHQALIYKYMVAGVPVPVQLVIPIWKSVAAATSLTSAYANYSSFMGCGSLCFDYRNSLEPEPGRCRRTDGKKWRCSRDVVPDQKYCERHMHRGRNRSRKPVEAAAAVVPTTAAVAASYNAAPQVSISVPEAGLQLMPAAASSRGSNLSPPRLGFPPTTVLRSTTACNTGPA